VGAGRIQDADSYDLRRRVTVPRRHVAIGRWPLTDRKPRPIPRSTVEVRQSAVLTADYTGTRWPKLEHAMREAADIAERYQPIHEIKPLLADVIDLLRGTPPADVVHVALHGQFDTQGHQEGLVLLAPTTDGKVVAQFLTPEQAETAKLASGRLFSSTRARSAQTSRCSAITAALRQRCFGSVQPVSSHPCGTLTMTWPA
jgi:hypothetical protein